MSEQKKAFDPVERFEALGDAEALVCAARAEVRALEARIAAHREAALDDGSYRLLLNAERNQVAAADSRDELLDGYLADWTSGWPVPPGYMEVQDETGRPGRQCLRRIAGRSQEIETGFGSEAFSRLVPELSDGEMIVETMGFSVPIIVQGRR